MIFIVDQLALRELPVGQKCAHLLHFDVLGMDGRIVALGYDLPRLLRTCQIAYRAEPTKPTCPEAFADNLTSQRQLGAEVAHPHVHQSERWLAIPDLKGLRLWQTPSSGNNPGHILIVSYTLEVENLTAKIEFYLT